MIQVKGSEWLTVQSQTIYKVKRLLDNWLGFGSNVEALTVKTQEVTTMKYFTKRELQCRCCRQLPDEARMNIEALADNVLDPVRAKFGKPIKVNSGYRCERHNRAVGGAKQSQHMCQGGAAAADICAEMKGYANMSDWKQANKELADLIIKNGKFDQLILENVGENDLLPAWVHVSWRRGGPNRGEVLKKVVGKAGYQMLTTDEICELLGPGFKKM